MRIFLLFFSFLENRFFFLWTFHSIESFKKKINSDPKNAFIIFLSFVLIEGWSFGFRFLRNVNAYFKCVMVLLCVVQLGLNFVVRSWVDFFVCAISKLFNCHLVLLLGLHSCFAMAFVFEFNELKINFVRYLLLFKILGLKWCRFQVEDLTEFNSKFFFHF